MKTKGAKKGIIGNSINKNIFEKLCAYACTKEEILEIINISESTLDKWIKNTYGQDENFKKVYSRFFALTKVSLRRQQIKQSENSIQMSIWLGKQYLGQSEKIENNNIEKVEIINNIPIEE